MILGFTGTQRGMTQRQADTVRYLFGELPLHVLHHGCCVGADAQAHRLAQLIAARIVGHPPTDRKKMAVGLTGYDRICEAWPYLARNRDIVKEGWGGLIAAPKSFIEPTSKRGQGTWTTVGYAREAKRRIWLVFPDGTFKEEQ